MREPDKILRIRTVLERTGLSRSTVYRKMLDGTFPNRIKISEHACGWRQSAIDRWIADPVSYREENGDGSTRRDRPHNGTTQPNG